MFLLLRYALRQLRESPGFAATAILTLTLGIGASTAIFAVLDAVLLEPLPFAQPDRLVVVASQPDRVVSIPTMQDYQSRSTTFSSLAAYREWSPTQKTTDATAASRILIVSQGFFSTLGTRFALSPQRRFSAVLGIHLAHLGRHVLGFLVLSNPAIPYRPMKKIARTLRAHRTLLLNYFKARKQFSSGVIEGLNNNAILWLSHLPHPGTRALSLTWQTTRAGAYP